MDRINRSAKTLGDCTEKNVVQILNPKGNYFELHSKLIFVLIQYYFLGVLCSFQICRRKTPIFKKEENTNS